MKHYHRAENSMQARCLFHVKPEIPDESARMAQALDSLC
jgi:hypothetical protein